MPVICCGINIFDYDQVVYLCDENNQMKELGKTPYQYLDHFITTMCNEQDVYRVKLMGLKEYTTQLKKRIEKESVARYGKKIEVEI